jgi:hypothetical protein
MSDQFNSKISAKRQELEDLLKEQADQIPNIEQFSVVAKRMGVDTKDLDELLRMAKGIFKSAGVKIPKVDE